MSTETKELITTVYNSDGVTMDVTLNLENLTENDVKNACATVNDLMNEHFNNTHVVQFPHKLKNPVR